MNKSTKITELVPAMYYRSRRVGGVRLVHLRKVTKIKIGNNYHGEPVYSTYPDRTTLCGVKNTELEAPTAEGAVLEPTCTKCKRLREKETRFRHLADLFPNVTEEEERELDELLEQLGHPDPFASDE